jgi:hypothetical protein
MESMQKKNTNYILVNSIGRGGAERQISYIASVAEIEKIICIEPLLSYPIPEKKLIFLSKGEGKIYQKIFQLICAPIKLKKFVDKNTHVICFLQLSYLLGY